MNMLPPLANLLCLNSFDDFSSDNSYKLIVFVLAIVEKSSSQRQSRIGRLIAYRLDHQSISSIRNHELDVPSQLAILLWHVFVFCSSPAGRVGEPVVLVCKLDIQFARSGRYTEPWYHFSSLLRY